MKNWPVLLVAITFFSSCNDNSEQLRNQVKKLEATNDSLLNITNSLKDKFVFDQARVKIVPSEKNSNKIGSEYVGTFVVIAYNERDEILFSTEMDKSNFELKNPIKLKRGFDGYEFKMNLKQKVNDIHFKVNLKNRLGRGFDGIIISDKKIAN